MFRNYLAAALRNLVRNRLYAAINIAGLATGIATALLIGLFVRDEFNYERWIPGFERVYLLQGIQGSPANKIAPSLSDATDKKVAPALRLAFPQVEAITRLNADEVILRRGEVESSEGIYWADEGTFKVLPLPAIAGDLATALERPDSIVLTRAIARKYFGRENVVGETVDLNRQHPLTVTAVLDDLPSNTNFDRAIWVAASAPFSPLMAFNASFNPRVFTVLRLAKGSDPSEFDRALSGFVERQGGLDTGSEKLLALAPIAIADIHLSPSVRPALKARGSRAVLMAVSAAGVLILLIAGINFINLMTAWAVRRATEVGVRKTSGAERLHLVLQFIGEALIYVFVSATAAVGLAQLLSPTIQAFLARNTFFLYWREPAFVLGVAALAIAFGILAGLYPALVLSAFRPASVLKSAAAPGSGSALLRRLLTTVQFAVLIGLVFATGIVYQQVRFAFNEGMRMDTDQALTIKTSCQDVFRDRVRALPGVAAAGCSLSMLDSGTRGRIVFTLPDGSNVGIGTATVDPGYFDVYGQHLVVGRMLTQGDASARGDLAVGNFNPPSNILINESAVRRFGFSAPDAALGQVLGITADAGPVRGMITRQVTIVGVVPDFALNAVATPLQPAIYWSDPSFYDTLHVKLNGRDIPETLAAIDALWKDVGDPRPIARAFLNQHLEDLYQGITRQAQIFSAVALIAVFVACLGVFGLAAFTAEQRTKEIGIRKAMGATRAEILGLLLWQFSQPVLCANLIAWPAGYFGMRYWLQGFAYHVDLSPWMFVAASILALAIAVATVIGHALLVARAQPASALRYE